MIPTEGGASALPYRRPMSQAGIGQLDPAIASRLLSQRATRGNSYANKRLSQFGQVADLLGGDFAQAFHGQDMSDPRAAFSHLSGLFSNASRGGGFADPRMFLQALLARAQGGMQGNVEG